jgi:protein-tyrosine sulfotransferase
MRYSVYVSLKKMVRRLRALSERYTLTGRRLRELPTWYFDRDAWSDAKGIVIGGAARSGTTLIRVMLDTHPRIRCGPESNLFRGQLNEGLLCRRFDVPRGRIRRIERESTSFPQFVTRFLSEYARQEGGTHWAEKSPANVLNLGWILDRFPNVMFCLCVRDGRAVVNSLRTHPRHRIVEGRLEQTGAVNDLEECISRWLREANAGLQFAEHPRVLIVRYEDVVTDPKAALLPLLVRVGLEWVPEMTRFHEIRRRSRDIARFPQNPEATQPLYDLAVEKWRNELTNEEIALIEKRGADQPARLGYW